MADIKNILDMLGKAIEDGRTVTIKADEIKIDMTTRDGVDCAETNATGLEITVE